MSLATVYNNLKALVEEGIVSEIKVNNDNTTYYDFMGHDHLNIVCENVVTLLDLDSTDSVFQGRGRILNWISHYS